MTGLVVLVGRGEQYGDPDDWRRLIERGRLTRTTVAPIRRDGVAAYVQADQVPELAAIFDEVEGVASAPAPMTLSPADHETSSEEIVPTPTEALEPAELPDPEPKPLGADVTHDAQPFILRPKAKPKPKKTDHTARNAWLVLLGLLLLVFMVSRCGSGGDAATVSRTVRTEVGLLWSADPYATPAGALQRGDTVDVELGTDSGFGGAWARVASGPSTDRYLPVTALAETPAPEVRVVDRDWRVRAASARIRAEPGLESAVLGALQAGNPVRVWGLTESGWAEVRPAPGTYGYVRADLLTDPGA